MQRALITGIHGFVGQHLRQALASHGWQVAGLGLSAPRITYPTTANGTGADEANYFVCDITDPQAVAHVVRTTQPDAIFHLASVMPVHKPPVERYYQVNVLGTLNVLEAARQFAPSAVVVLTTSSAMYGRALSSNGLIDETTPLLPVNAYGVSKAAQHLLGYQYADEHKLCVIRVCPFNLIGPGLPRGLVASDFAYQLAAIEAGQQAPLISVGDLSAGRDFLDVRDAMRAYRLIVEIGKAGDFFNVSSGQAVRIRDLLDILIEQAGFSVEIQQRTGALAANPIPIQIGTNHLLRQAIDWSPEIPLEQSLADILTSYRQSMRENL